MTAGITIMDLSVKQLIVRWRTGTGSWRTSGQPIFTVGKDYRLSVVFGNYSSPVFEGDLYDKENIRISLNPLGIRTSTGYIHRGALQFYDGASFSTAVPHPPDMHIPGPFKTTHADLMVGYLYFRPTPPIQSFPVNRFRFMAIINAAIRNRRSHQVMIQI